MRPRRNFVADSIATTVGRPAVECGEQRVNVLRHRDPRRGEVLPHPLVRRRRQQHGDGVVERPPGAADLLVVGNRRGGRPDVDAERQVRFVEAHPERRRGNERFHLVAS